ncbi:uncharacterized protein PHACADRAFT_253696 [Phanerochaete carnosa HHB-10118-sp]|uniref:Small ribosomal subunit protein uS7 domain-containing protein n=1 Tax=Phanerochaete carnosa (strain HHB-10118-sp) TaxID=650164 RepID=K5WBD7_PHACS|nr:uncharacterized protein PHACADRAFT_253696 [Phanerochaete carnosa HHB-10118-sp]EKM56520.1 hypothetical protein PHACADRAFT_253696 [Phanerochaete carnosa HHB-10118-sp]
MFYAEMLVLLRRAATNTVRQSARSVTTTPNDASLVNEALGVVGSVAGQKSAFQQPLTAPTPTPAASPLAAYLKNDQPPLMLIPPEEDPLLHYMTSVIQKHGERKKAAGIVARMLLHIHTLTRVPPLPVVRRAVLDAAPACKNVTMVHGTKRLFKPIALGEKQRTRYAIQWILESSNKRPEHKLEERLAREMIDIIQCTDPKENDTLKKKLEVHTLAMRNRANATMR